MPFTTDAARWRALSTRDSNANGHFVYSVKSTNVFCRPTCPARLARRANVGFYETAAQAEAAGYRACKRCKPEAESTEDPQDKAVAKACSLIEDALKQDDVKAFRLQDLAKNVGLTPRYFHKIFKDKMGLTPKEYTKTKMEEQRSVSATPASHDELVDPELSNLEAFDFNDLVDFNAGSGLPMDDPLDLDVIESTIQSTFGAEVDVNIQVPVLVTGGPNTMDPGLGISDDKLYQWINSASFYDAAMTTSDTFKFDAALVLSDSTLPEFNGGMYTNVFV